MKQKLGVGIIGFNHWYIANEAARYLVEHPAAKLLAIAHPKIEVVRNFSETFGAEAYADYEELLKRDDIDIVVIVTSTDMMAKATVDSAEAQKHILLGKPIAMNLIEADQMLSSVKKANIKASSFQSFRRIHPFYLRVKELIDSDVIGAPSVMHGVVHSSLAEDEPNSGRPGWFADPKRCPGGAFMDEGLYMVDLARWIFGDVKLVRAAEIRNVTNDLKVEDLGHAVLEFKKGSFATVEGTWTLLKPDVSTKGDSLIRSQIIGPGGEIIVDEVPVSTVKVLSTNVKHYRNWTTMLVHGPYGPFVETAPKFGHFPVVLDDVIDSIKEDRSPLIMLKDARDDLEVGLAVYKSAKTGEPVKLPLDTRL